MNCEDPVRTTGCRFSRRRALWMGGVGLAASAAVGQGLGARSVAAQDATPVATPGASGTPTGANSDRIALAAARIPALATDILARTGVPGMAVALVANDRIAFLQGFGVRELGKPDPIDADTVFQLASVSKSLAATVVSAVVGDGAMRWDSRLADIAPGFALGDPWASQEVTFADLFAHRSGLPDHAGDLLEDLGFGADEIIRRLRYLPMDYPFRAGYRYTNFGLSAAAYAAGRVAGMPWDDLCAKRLYEPLGMAHTSSRFSDYMAQANRAIPQVKRSDRWIVTPQQRNPDPQTPAGGVSSTARDLAQWLRLQLGNGTYEGKQVVAPEALVPMHTPQSVSRAPGDPARERAGFYGLGINIGYPDSGPVQWSHSGAFSLGAATAYNLVSAAGFGVLALTNGYPVGAPEALCLGVVDLALRGDITQDWLATVTPFFAALATPGYGTTLAAGAHLSGPALPVAAYAGTYRNDFYGEATVAASGDALVLRLGPKPMAFPLTHVGRDTFSWEPTGENAGRASALTFVVGPAGTASAFTDDYLGSGGPGTLTRAGA